MIKLISIVFGVLIFAIGSGDNYVEKSEWIKPTNTSINDSLKPKYHIVGAVFKDKLLGTNRTIDSVTIYKINLNQQWQFYQRLLPNKTLLDQKFGLDVALYEKIAVVSSLEVTDYYSSKAILVVGSAHVFQLDSLGMWVETQKIYSPEMVTENNFGSHLSLNNDILLIGDSYCQTDTNGDISKNIIGANYLYKLGDNGLFSFSKKLPIYDFGDRVITE